jgi:XTP/dITP diphosphohydrolase
VPGQLVLLATTPRVAPGLLSWDAWSALRSAGKVLAADAEHPLARPLAEAGIEVGAEAPGRGAALGTRLLDLARSTDVVWLCGPDGDPGLVAELILESAPRQSATPDSARPAVRVVAGSWDVPGARLVDLVRVMDRLRSPGGCPWDAEQTHTSLVPYVIEETYELVEAIEEGTDSALREELGDLLLQVVFHSRIAEERTDGPWSVDDVAATIVGKLISRHPHVFSDGYAPTAADVEANWEELKRVEKGRESAVDGVPLAQPALALAAALLARAERAGVAVGVPAPDGGGDAAVHGDSGVAPATGRDPGAEHADAQALVGAELMATVARARRLGVDPEAALRAAARSYAADVRQAERS